MIYNPLYPCSVVAVPIVETWQIFKFFIYIYIYFIISCPVCHYSEALEQIIEMHGSDFHSKLSGMPQLKQQGMKLPTLSYLGG